MRIDLINDSVNEIICTERFAITRLESGGVHEDTPKSEAFSNSQDVGRKLCAFYHLEGSPACLGECSECPLVEGEKLMTAEECQIQIDRLDGVASMLKVQWSLEDLVDRNAAWASLDVMEHSAISPMTGRERMVLGELLDAPAMGDFTPLWFEGKALELLALGFASCESPPTTKRQDLVNRDRAQRVCAILNHRYVDPPALQELARQAGCSKFCLSRIFSEVMGMSIPQFIRERRIREAAVLLGAGRHNVTEAAFAVGYSSLGHFSTAFREIIGCCPGLYPLNFRHVETIGKPLTRSQATENI